MRKTINYHARLSSPRNRLKALVLLAVCLVIATISLSGVSFAVKAKKVKRFVGSTSSQTLALTADDAFLAVANPDNNSVTFFEVQGDQNHFLAEVPVQTEPNGVAFTPDGKQLFVANTVSGTVSV